MWQHWGEPQAGLGREAGLEGGRPDEECQQRKAQQAHAESLKLGGSEAVFHRLPAECAGLLPHLGAPHHVATPITTDDRRLSGEAPATSEMKPTAH